MTDFQWRGFDPINALLGGQGGKLKSMADIVSSIATAVKTINKFNSLIQSALDISSARLLLETEASLLKAAVDAILQEAKNSLDDLKGTSAYYIDLSQGQQELTTYYKNQFVASDCRVKISQLKRDLSTTTLDADQITAKNHELNLQSIKLATITNRTGGTAGYYKTFIDSLDDQYDPNRPLFSDSARIFALFVMYGASDLTKFLKMYEGFCDIFKANPSVKYLPPLQNLKAKFVEPSSYNAMNAKISNFWNLGATRFNKNVTSSTVANTPTTQVMEVGKHFVTSQHSTFPTPTIPDIAVVITDTNSRDDTVYGIKFTEYAKGLLTAKTSLYRIKLCLDDDTRSIVNKNYTFILNKDTMDITDTSFIEEEGTLIIVPTNLLLTANISVGSATYANTLFNKGNSGCIFYSPTTGGVDNEKALITADPGFSAAANNNAVLTWEYGKNYGLFSNIFGPDRIKYTAIYILKKKITNKDIFSDLRTLVATKKVPDKTDELEIEALDALYGIRNFTSTKVSNITDATTNGISGYDFMAGCGYTIEQKLSFGALQEKILYPVVMCDMDEATLTQYGYASLASDISNRKKAFKASRQSIYASITDADLKAEIKSKFDPDSDDFFRPIDWSNVAHMDIGKEYDFTLSTPPDWKSLPHLYQIWPPLFDAIDYVITYIQNLIDSIQNAFDFLPNLLDSIKSDINKGVEFLIATLNSISNMITSLSKLSAGAYFMVVSADRGGINLARKALAISLQGPYVQEGNTTGNFLQKIYEQGLVSGPPPFEQEDYVGGFALVGGTIGNLAQTFSPLFSQIGNSINNMEEDFLKAIDLYDVNWSDLQNNIRKSLDFSRALSQIHLTESEKKKIIQAAQTDSAYPTNIRNRIMDILQSNNEIKLSEGELLYTEYFKWKISRDSVAVMKLANAGNTLEEVIHVAGLDAISSQIIAACLNSARLNELIDAIQDCTKTDLVKEIFTEVLNDVQLAGILANAKKELCYTNLMNSIGPPKNYYTTVTIDEDTAKKMGYLKLAVTSINSGDYYTTSAAMANSIPEVPSSDLDGFVAAGTLMGGLKNYDGTPFDSLNYQKLQYALLTANDGNPNANKFIDAAVALKDLGLSIPNDPTLFKNSSDYTNYVNFLTSLLQAVTLQLANIPITPELQGARVTLDPFAILPKRPTLEQDNYQYGWNVAVWNKWDSRLLNGKVHNDTLESVIQNSSYEVMAQNNVWLNKIHNTEWEVALVS